MLSGGLNNDVEKLREDNKKVESDWAKLDVKASIPVYGYELRKSLSDINMHLSDLEVRAYSSLRKRKEDIERHDKHLKQLGQDCMNHGFKISQMEKQMKNNHYIHLAIEILLFLAICIMIYGLSVL